MSKEDNDIINKYTEELKRLNYAHGYRIAMIDINIWAIKNLPLELQPVFSSAINDLIGKAKLKDTL